MEDANKKEILKMLELDKNYYGDYGKQYLSNSDISTLLTNPLALGTPLENRPAFLIGGYFHTAILEPEKLKNFKIVEATTRNTKAYREISDGEICLLQHEVDKTELLVDKIMSNDICRDLIRGVGNDVDYERPGIKEIGGHMWKGKADIINHSEKLIIDLKTTADISKFQYSAKKYNYDSQAYIYQKLFGYDLIFMGIDKSSHQIGIFDCSARFIESGKDKVEQAIESYELFFKNPDFDPKQFFINKTL
jgi:hypothetical protein